MNKKPVRFLITYPKNISAEVSIFIVSVFIVLFFNKIFWKKFIDYSGVTGASGAFFIVSSVLIIVFFVALVIGGLPFKIMGRLFVSFLFLAGSAASYFMAQYGVAIDAHMVQNIIETDVNEIADLVTWKLLAYVVVVGVLPTVIIWRLNIRKLPFWVALKKRAFFMCAAFLMLLLCVIANYQG
ncbi:MAG: phosphoethanolamine transferase domain-containing protein, partial [Moraxellaceae bacterium]